MQSAQQEVFSKVLAMANKPLLYGPNDKPLRPTGTFAYRRDAAKKTGSMKNWVPSRLFSRQSEAIEREDIVARSIDLTQNDPHAAGVVDTFASTVIGAGLVPHPTLDPDILGIDKEEARRIQLQQRSVYQTWAPIADAGGRMNFGQVQYLSKVCMLRYGEYFVVLPMVKGSSRPYSLACQIIHPLRVKTPVDLLNKPNVRDGIELGPYGEARAIYIKKSETTGRILPDISKHFIRMPLKRGHRRNVLHGFVAKEPEQVRGVPFFAPAMKYFRDFNDLLNAELVSNVVTAALTYFIEVSGGEDPYGLANNLATLTDTRYDSDGSTRDIRYQETYPGAILYGSPGETPHLLSANRPGTTFEPFTRTVKKSIAMALNMPYPVLFKDVENVNFAGFRSAMLDAWRVFEMERKWHGAGLCQPIYTMLMEEAYLRGNLDVSDFYGQMHALTKAEWRGAPKGDIEPIKAVQADVLAIQNNLKTRAESIAERGGDVRIVFDQLEEEREMLEEKGLPTGAELGPEDKPDDEDADESK